VNIIKIIVWRLAGWIFPPAQAYWANHVIMNKADKTVDESGNFDSAFVSNWERILSLDNNFGFIPDQIYEHEMNRRDSITNKAQASLNTISLIIAILALAAATVEPRMDILFYFPTWAIVLISLYLFFAFLSAFHAVHIHRYSAVEYDEFENLVNKIEKDSDHNFVVCGIRARRLAAICHNRQQTLRVANLVDASFQTLRNGIAILIFSLVFTSIFSETSGSVDKYSYQGGQGSENRTVTDKERGSNQVPSKRY
jgi:hypothetical protein